MSVYLDEIKLEFPDVYKARELLNAEFLEKGRIIDAVSFLYYPVQHGPMPHGEMEIEGLCYYFRSCVGPCNIPEVKSYHGRIYKIHRRSKGSRVTELAFVRFSIPVTPKQLDNIQKDIENLRGMVGLTCMHGVKRALKKYAGYSIPFPICLYPTTTATTLYISKNVLGSKKISRIEPQISHRSRGELFADVTIGVVSEMLVIAVCVGWIYITTFMLSMTYDNRLS